MKTLEGFKKQTEHPQGERWFKGKKKKKTGCWPPLGATRQCFSVYSINLLPDTRSRCFILFFYYSQRDRKWHKLEWEGACSPWAREALSFHWVLYCENLSLRVNLILSLLLTVFNRLGKLGFEKHSTLRIWLFSQKGEFPILCLLPG